jgi:hypothetical protein
MTLKFTHMIKNENEFSKRIWKSTAVLYVLEPSGNLRNTRFNINIKK